MKRKARVPDGVLGDLPITCWPAGPNRWGVYIPNCVFGVGDRRMVVGYEGTEHGLPIEAVFAYADNGPRLVLRLVSDPCVAISGAPRIVRTPLV